ncbi:MAG: phosphate ABC transporter substrate-binding protein PstS [Solirubrobacteraceae bacterium MAG38_C4-C5]|nr:phosphate ABC transporter substrate-binding protein PstS [Candidatus Siliceabacter maunaloa]
MRSFRTSAVLSCLALALGVAACGGDDEAGGGSAGGGGEPAEELEGTLAGAGSSAQAAAMEAWIVGFQDQNPGVTISYDPVGSGGGREQFEAGGTDFGGSDAALEEEELAGTRERCGEVIQLPAYVSPIAVAYNLPGVENLQLNGETVAGIFNQDITNWNDPAIAETNPDAQLPDLAITPVNRSDESGTTENFVEYLSVVAPEIWDYEVTGDWPVPGGEAGDGTSGVVDAIEAGEGAIGYSDASQVGDLGVANVQVGEEFVGPTPEAAAEILGTSERDDTGGEFSFVYDLERDTTESGTYPITLVSYQLACTQYDDPQKAELVKAFFTYAISPEGQEAAAENAGSAPITDEFRELITPAVEAIGGAG